MLLGDWSKRQRHPEWMDEPNLDEVSHQQALGQLARLNRWGLAVLHLWPHLARLAVRLHGRLRILDLATGSGDIPIALFQRAQQRGWRWRIAGCDVSATAVAYAQQHARKWQLPVEFFVCDVLKEDWPGEWDVVMCSLFVHHLDEAQAVQLMRRMGQSARHLVLVSDLERSPVHYLLVWTATRLLCRSPIIQADGPISVQAAYTVREATTLAKAAWGRDFTIWRRPPARWLLVKRCYTGDGA